ncbi:hypothetical protein HC251_18855 [Iamia sp. SCSIO 61187]|uniref:hypothetical protein n=1 Tax=Iamia sp. SCSIO 61187 TaxID=2722752 RepID=UPI001C6379DA|nr:hypothetical protein [Iamia sp. SCSIO 61187]QYG94289.1 hypothetical protein HC251_18855 [Iamia sp. SCSIO 61187]
MMDGRREGLILLDIPPGMDEHFDVSFLERTGHPVEVCRGPQDRPCPLLGGLGCPKFESAHGIVFELDLDLDRVEHREILEQYQALTDGNRPIRVVVPAGQAERYRDVLAGVEIWAHEPTVAELDGFAARVEATDR